MGKFFEVSPAIDNKIKLQTIMIFHSQVGIPKEKKIFFIDAIKKINSFYRHYLRPNVEVNALEDQTNNGEEINRINKYRIYHESI